VLDQNWKSGVLVDEELVFPPDRVRAQLEQVLASELFSRSDRLIRFLRFAVEQALRGHSECLKEQTIGVEVFDRKPDYDPRIDPIVRVEARRLRSKLKDYYDANGNADQLLIELPKGSYVPVFRSRAAIQTRRAEPAEKSIAVLPFANLTPDAGEDFFSDGLTEELILLLTRIPHFRVVAWETVSRLRGREQDLAGIREQLKIGAILRGSVRRLNGRIRVTTQLIDAESGSYLWSEAFDRQMEDIFAIQEQIARAIVETLQLKLQPRRLGESSGREMGMQCHYLCLQGRFHANKRTRDGLLKSVSCFEQAIQIEPGCAVAYAGVADAYSLLADNSVVDPREVIVKAKSAAEAALRIDPDCAEAHVSLALIRGVFESQWSDGEMLYRRAIALNPGYARAHHWYAVDHLAPVGRLDEALSEVLTAHHLDPLSQIIFEGCGYAHMLRREYPAALKTYQQLIDLDPDFYKGHASMGRVLSLMGRYDEAIASLEKARSIAGEAPTILSAFGHTFACAGRVDEARCYLQKLQEMSDSKMRWVPAACFGIIHLGLGNHELALRYFETSANSRELAATFFKVHPLYDCVRAHPRFQAILHRCNLLP
jgi:serine/threonine-protein kinase